LSKIASGVGLNHILSLLAQCGGAQMHEQ